MASIFSFNQPERCRYRLSIQYAFARHLWPLHFQQGKEGKCRSKCKFPPSSAIHPAPPGPTLPLPGSDDYSVHQQLDPTPTESLSSRKLRKPTIITGTKYFPIYTEARILMFFWETNEKTLCMSQLLLQETCPDCGIPHLTKGDVQIVSSWYTSSESECMSNLSGQRQYWWGRGSSRDDRQVSLTTLNQSQYR